MWPEIPRRWTFREATRLESLHLGGGDDFWQLTTRLLTTLTPNKAGGFIDWASAYASSGASLFHWFIVVFSSGGRRFGYLSTAALLLGEIPALLDRADCFSVVANAQQQNGNVSGETTTTSSVPCNSNSNLDRVKTKPGETD